jgi:hypothetical protein
MTNNFFLQYLLNLFEDCLKDPEKIDFEPIRIKRRSFIYCEKTCIPFKIKKKSVTWSKLYDTTFTHSTPFSVENAESNVTFSLANRQVLGDLRVKKV